MSANLDLLEVIAHEVRPLLDEIVFVGGATAELYATLPVLPRIRATTDTDAVCEATTYVEYAQLGRRLESLGFRQALRHGDPPYRWRSPAGVLDLMPINEQVLGFTNPWYTYGVASAVEHTLSGGQSIRILSPPAYLATKLAAFEGRGKQDPYLSHDLEDIVALLARRPELVAEVEAAPAELHGWVRDRFAEFLTRADAEELVGANLPGGAALAPLRRTLMERMRLLAS
ncbi:MAG TPA: hypothetical protein VJT67_05080 [Longimicrobiaceae bacterium]|nr:hypothetical protein [Longimicrobiaceae bacterium]